MNTDAPGHQRIRPDDNRQYDFYAFGHLLRSKMPGIIIKLKVFFCL